MSLEALKRNGHNLALDTFEAAGEYGIPVLQPVQLTVMPEWIAFNAAMTAENRRGLGVHFFVDDYLFQRTWNDPRRYAQMLMRFTVVMTPDFSLFTDYPVAVQIYNHYRKHLLGAYWQSLGMTVIPSVCWSDEASFDWCFDGEPTGGCVAVSSVGTQKSRAAQALFMAGYREMLVRLKPSNVIFFGDVPAGCDGNLVRVSSYYSSLAHARKQR